MSLARANKLLCVSPTLRIFFRGVGRRKQYGHEEGYDIKNEVRKEAWHRKRMRRPMGGDFRESKGLVGNPKDDGVLANLMDYSFVDGRPGIPSTEQIKRRLIQKNCAEDIKEAFELMKMAQNVSKVEDELQSEREPTVNPEFKPKGKKSFTDFL